MSWSKPCSSLTQSGIRISAEKWKPRDWAWLIFCTQLVHSLAVPDSSFCTSVQMGGVALVFANPLFLLFFGFWRTSLDTSHKERKSLCSTKERIKGGLRNNLGSSTSPHSRGKRVPHLSSADGNRGSSSIHACFAGASPLSSDLNFPSMINFIQLVACWHSYRN